MLPHVGTYEDLYDLANQMIGELNASHVGIRGAPSRPMDNQYQMKFLGVELVPANGRYRVTHVYRDGPADKERLDIEAETTCWRSTAGKSERTHRGRARAR